MRLEVQKKNADVEAARTLQRMIENPVYPLTEGDREAIAHQIALLTAGYDFLERLPDPDTVYYTASDIGRGLGISENHVMKAARCALLVAKEGKSSEYGMWTGGLHKPAQWLFTEEGRRRTVEALQSETRRIEECARGCSSGQ